VSESRSARIWEVFLVFLRLGVSSFGGPVAHIGYFRDEFVVRRAWLSDKAYGDLVALCQFLPGPASSQVGMGVGISRAGIPGAIAAWCGFTIPSAALLILFAQGIAGLSGGTPGWLLGLKVLAVAVVAQAVIGMAKSFCCDRVTGGIAITSMSLVLASGNGLTQLAAIAIGATAGRMFITSPNDDRHDGLQIPVNHTLALGCMILFFLLLLVLPVAAMVAPGHGIELFDRFYRAGALVFGGGHVVLPLLQAAVAKGNWISNELFMYGYGAAQAVPGPLFTFAAYLGAAAVPEPHGVPGGMLALTAIFLPSFLLVIALLPYWAMLRHNSAARSTLSGVNASVVGILGAALYPPLWTSAINSTRDMVLAVLAFGMLVVLKQPPWRVVIFALLAGMLFQ